MEPAAAYSLIKKHVSVGEAGEWKDWDRYEAWYSAESASSLEGLPISPASAVLPVGSDDSDLKFQTNQPFAFIDTMAANVCPQNPEIVINTTSESNKEAAKARERLINSTIKFNKLHDTFWTVATHAAISGRGIIKTVWSETKKRPVSIEVNPRAFFFDMSQPYEYTRYVCQAVPITRGEFDKRLKRSSKFGYNKEAAKLVPKSGSGYPKWLRPVRDQMSKDIDDAARDELEWVTIFEFYDLADGNFYHFADGVEKPLLHMKRLPFKFMRNPFSLLVFNKNLKNSGGISDIKLISDLLERMNEIDTIELNHAHKSYPRTFLDRSGLEDPESAVKALEDAGPSDIIAVATQNGIPIQNVLAETGTSQVLPAFELAREKCAAAIDSTLGMPQYARGKTGTSDVATELALVDTAARTRNGRRVKCMSDLLVDVAKKMGALWHEFMDEKRQIPVKVDEDSGEVDMLDREKLGYDNELLSADINDENIYEESWFFEWEVVPFSPTENHRLVQLNKLQTFYPLLLQNPYIDTAKLTRKLTEVLGMDEIYDPQGLQKQQQQAQQAQAQGQQQNQGTAPKGTPADVIATGAMPEGTVDAEDMNSTDSHAMAQQPVY